MNGMNGMTRSELKKYLMLMSEAAVELSIPLLPCFDCYHLGHNTGVSTLFENAWVLLYECAGCGSVFTLVCDFDEEQGQRVSPHSLTLEQLETFYQILLEDGTQSELRHTIGVQIMQHKAGS